MKHQKPFPTEDTPGKIPIEAMDPKHAHIPSHTAYLPGPRQLENSRKVGSFPTPRRKIVVVFCWEVFVPGTVS